MALLILTKLLLTLLNKSLAKRFPQLDLAGSKSIDGQRDEFMDFTLSPLDRLVVETYKSATGDQEPKADVLV